MSHSFTQILPGIGLLAVIAGLAHVLGGVVPVVTPLILAIAIGAAIANAVEVPVTHERGISKHPLLLETAIVLLAARLSLGAVIAAGPQLGILVVTAVGFGVLIVSLLAKAMKLNERMGSLLAAGSSICGISAIAAVAPICKAEDTQVAHAQRRSFCSTQSRFSSFLRSANYSNRSSTVSGSGSLCFRRAQSPPPGSPIQRSPESGRR